MKLAKAVPTSVATVRDEFDRLFDQLRHTGLFGPAPRVFETMWTPSADFSESEKEYVLRVEAPGVAKDDFDLNIEGQTLTVSGRRDFEKEEKTEEYFWREREAGRFVRSIQLPTPIDRAKVTAEYHDGILTIRVPKSETGAKARIPIT